MSHVEIHSKADSDGSVILNVPLGVSQANREVKITADSSLDRNELSVAEWQNKIEKTAGQWSGGLLERPEQIAFEKRDAWT
jgi:hypothetical protein